MTSMKRRADDTLLPDDNKRRTTTDSGAPTPTPTTDETDGSGVLARAPVSFRQYKLVSPTSWLYQTPGPSDNGMVPMLHEVLVNGKLWEYAWRMVAVPTQGNSEKTMTEFQSPAMEVAKTKGPPRRKRRHEDMLWSRHSASSTSSSKTNIMDSQRDAHPASASRLSAERLILQNWGDPVCVLHPQLLPRAESNPAIPLHLSEWSDGLVYRLAGLAQKLDVHTANMCLTELVSARTARAAVNHGYCRPWLMVEDVDNALVYAARAEKAMLEDEEKMDVVENTDLAAPPQGELVEMLEIDDMVA